MRARALPILVVLVLAGTLGVASACGGGDDEAGDTGFTDTGLVFPIDTSEVVEPAPPAEQPPAEQPQEALQIPVPKAGESIGPQSPAALVAELQGALLALGFKIGTPDGIYGQKTRNSVSRFQKNHKLEQDGLVGPKTAKAINKELRERAAANA
jgi:peptidoglycan hydrolase-like protein with peptidoglycan-binding domain